LFAEQFNANWTIDGVAKGRTLFEMIKNTHKKTPDHTVSAYSDNAAVLEGANANFWAPEYSTGSWKLAKELVHMLCKVETHNHPTAIAPFPGAATGSGVCAPFLEGLVAFPPVLFAGRN
jgi:phosphoribosylformylglycinamidine synthase